MQLRVTCRPLPEAYRQALSSGWAGQASWCVLEPDASPGPGLFLAMWQAWRSDPDRPRLLHYVAACPEENAWDADALCTPPSPEAREEDVNDETATALARALRGPEPSGWRRLVFEEGRVLLTLMHAADPVVALRVAQVRADLILLRGGCPDDPIMVPTADGNELHRWKALARMARRGTRLVAAATTAPCAGGQPPLPAAALGDVAALPAAARAAGFVAPSPSPPNPPSGIRLPAQPAWASIPARLTDLGRFDPSWTPRKETDQPAFTASECVVIGAGIAGAAVAASLARRGWRVTVLEAGERAAWGASSLPAGIFAPAHSADDNALSRLSRAGVRMLIAFASAHLQRGTDWQASGVLQRLPEAPGARPAGVDISPMADGDAVAPGDGPTLAHALAQAGLEPASTPALWHPLAGWIRPARLVAGLLATPGVTLRCGTTVSQITEHPDGRCTLRGEDGAVLAQVPLVVVAAGHGSDAWLGADFALQAIAGQVSIGRRPDGAGDSAALSFPVNGHGSFIDDVELADGSRHWLAGATFERDADAGAAGPDSARIRAAHKENLGRLTTLLPAVAQSLGAPPLDGRDLDHWRGIRAVAKDRLPIVGPVRPGSAHPGLWACTAMGSRGLSLGLLCGELLAAWLHHEPLPVPGRLAACVSARRFRCGIPPSAAASYAYSDKRKTNM